jgi:hypothetical protein
MAGRSQLEYWNGGAMGMKEQKQLKINFSVFTTHSSIIPLFHGRGKTERSEPWKLELPLRNPTS